MKVEFASFQTISLRDVIKVMKTCVMLPCYGNYAIIATGNKLLTVRKVEINDLGIEGHKDWMKCVTRRSAGNWVVGDSIDKSLIQWDK